MNCPYPPEADKDKIDQAMVILRVTVRPDGTASDVSLVSDPGHGFGSTARACILAARFRPALDRAGIPILSSTIINLRFWR